MTSIDNFEFAHRHRREVVWMSQNTNTIPMPRDIKDAILPSVDAAEYNLYPFKPWLFGPSAGGSGYTRSEVKGLAEVAKDHGLWLIDDITYRDFHPAHTLASEFYPERTLISYSFSKGCGLAGMRVGALLAMPDAMKEIKRYDTNVLGTNVLAQRAALAGLQCKGTWLPMVRGIVARNQEIIRDTVKRMKGCSLPVYPSKANMFVIDTAPTGVNPD